MSNLDKDNVEFLIRDLKAMGYNKTFIISLSNVLKDLEYNKKQFAVQLDEKLTLKSELETSEKIAEKLEQDNFILANENLNSVGKDKIQAEIEELKSKGKIINQTLPYCGEYKNHKEIKVLEKLLKS